MTRNDVRRAAQIGVGGEAMARWWSCALHVLGKECWRASRFAVAHRLGPGHLKLKRAKKQINF